MSLSVSLAWLAQRITPPLQFQLAIRLSFSFDFTSELGSVPASSAAAAADWDR